MADSRSVTRRRALHIAAVAGVGSALGAGVIAELIRQGRVHRVSRTQAALGTLVSLTLISPSRDHAEAAMFGGFAQIDALEGVLSRHRADSALSRLNRQGALKDPPQDLLRVLVEANRIAYLTGGAFDVTVAPLLRFHERAHEEGRGPTPEVLDGVLQRVDYRALQVDVRKVRFLRPGMSVTLDGIAKGYVVDRTVEHLGREGFSGVLVDAGGDIASRGGARGTLRGQWNVAVQDPHGGVPAETVALSDGACIATSGDYMRPFTADRVHHPVVDPRTGISPIHTSSASVVSRSAMLSDALSTTAMILGPTEGIHLLAETADVDGLIVAKDGTRFKTEHWMAGG